MSEGFTMETIDWSKEWARTYARSSIIMRRANSPSYWDKRASRFSAMDNGANGRVQAILDRLPITDRTTILDIGCGPGNLAIPLARSAGHVTALDPAKGMLEKLTQFSEQAGVTNITTINNGWEEAVENGEIAQHDIVLSSYSLMMKDIGSAIKAMDAAAKKTVCVFWFAGKECFGYDRFWPALFGETYTAGPDHVLLLNILNSMGIYPEVSIIPQQHVTGYADFDDAVDCWFENLYASTDKERETIRDILSEALETDNGKPILRRTVRSAMIWWNKK